MWSLYRSVVVKKELSWKAKLSIYQSICIPTLTYGHRKYKIPARWQGAPLEIGQVEELCHLGGAQSRAAAPPHQEEPAEVARSSVSDTSWMLPQEGFLAYPTGRRPQGRPRTHRSDTLEWRAVTQLAWECLGTLPEELEEVSGEREVWVSLLRQLPLQPSPG